MTIESAIQNLQAAFDEVAHEIEAKYPNIWKKAVEVYSDGTTVDTDASVNFLIASPRMGWGDKSLLDVAEEFGEQPVLDYIDAIQAGVYM